MSEWKPIETAPKDGTAIWVAHNAHDYMEPVRTLWHHFGEWTNIYSGNSIAWRPTHWMPLPEPPKRPYTRADYDAAPEDGRATDTPAEPS